MSDRIPQRVDGLDQSIDTSNQAFTPVGILEHEYLPIDTVIIREYENDLSYMVNYFHVERLWKVFIDRDTFDRLLSRFLAGNTVIVNYGEPGTQKFDVFVPKEGKIAGFQDMYIEILKEINSMDRSQLSEHMDKIGYDVLYQLGVRPR
jgi:hypothetical protein